MLHLVFKKGKTNWDRRNSMFPPLQCKRNRKWLTLHPLAGDLQLLDRLSAVLQFHLAVYQSMSPGRHFPGQLCDLPWNTKHSIAYITIA